MFMAPFYISITSIYHVYILSLPLHFMYIYLKKSSSVFYFTRYHFYIVQIYLSLSICP